MARKDPKPPTLDQASAWLRKHGAHVEQHGDKVRVVKDGCAAVLVEATSPLKQKVARFAQQPHLLLAGKPAQIVDRGFQKFLDNGALQVAATADHLKALHNFQEELAQAIGRDQIYNEALGTVSDSYLYDRVRGRE